MPCTFIALCCHNPKCQSKQCCCKNPYTKITKSLPIRNQYSQFCRKFIMFLEMFYFIFSIKYTSFSNQLFSFEYNLSFILAKRGIHKTKINIINSPKIPTQISKNKSITRAPTIETKEVMNIGR